MVALTYEAMGLLAPGRKVNWYDPGRFWSGDQLQLVGAELGGELAVDVDHPVDLVDTSDHPAPPQPALRMELP